MKTFTYTVKDELGIHARPAGLLVKAAKPFVSTVIIKKEDGKTADATRLMAIMGLGIKCGNMVEVSAEGEDEARAIEAVETFFQTNL